MSRPTLVGILFLVTLTTLVGLIAWVLFEGSMKTVMSLAAVAYALAALGFLSVIAWAYAKGQFDNYEAIKDEIFEIEARK